MIYGKRLLITFLIKLNMLMNLLILTQNLGGRNSILENWALSISINIMHDEVYLIALYLIIVYETMAFSITEKENI